jgi:hypothetical protein
MFSRKNHKVNILASALFIFSMVFSSLPAGFVFADESVATDTTAVTNTTETNTVTEVFTPAAASSVDTVINTTTTANDGDNVYCLNGGSMSYEKFVEAKNAGLISFGIVTDTNTNLATVNLSNQTGCSIPMSLSSYSMFDTTLSHQVLFDNTGIINATSSTVYTVNIPSCMAQIDFWYDLAPTTLLDSNPYGNPPPPIIVGYGFVRNNGNGFADASGQFCSNIITNTPPTITLTGANPLNLTIGDTFVDPGATATDTEDGDLTSHIVVTGTVNASTTGTYILTYSVTDSGGLSASTTRTVIVVPSGGGNSCTNQTPTGSISVDGANAILVVPAGACPIKISFSSYSFKETIRPFDEQILVDNITDTYGPGTYHIGPIHLACKWQTDLYGGEVQTQLNPDYGHSNLIATAFNENPGCNIPPVITLIGPNPDSVTIGEVFNDHGAIAMDEEDGNITSDIVTTGTVNTGVAGTYVITYLVTDSGGLSASTTRTVNVNPIFCKINCGPTNTPPTITVIGANPLNLTVGDTFVDPGATATDLEDGDATTTSHIIATSTVNTAVVGSYTVTYSVTDSGGLSASAIRSVVVSSTTPPVNPPVNPPSGGGGGGGGSRSSHRHPIVIGEVLGATSCYYLRDFLKIDWQNDKIEVLKLQSFLNVFEKENLSLTGVFDQSTFEAVQRFQNKYPEDILKPWGDKVTTGFVYILTKKKVNEIYCNTLFPVNQTEQNEIDAFRSSGGNNIQSQPQSQSQKSQNQNPFYTEGSYNDGANIPVVDLSSNSTTSTSTSGSVVRNAAVSLFALPQKIFNNSRYFFIFLILLIIAIAIIKLLSSSRKSFDAPVLVTPVAKTDNKTASPVIVLPGIVEDKKETSEILPDEEIVIENPEEGPEEIITTPDFRYSGLNRKNKTS